MTAPQPNVPELTTPMNNIGLNSVAQDTAQLPNMAYSMKQVQATILEQLNAKRIQINQFVDKINEAINDQIHF